MNKLNKNNIYSFEKKQELNSEKDKVLERLILSVLKEHQADLNRFFKFRLAGHPDREDLMQDILLRLMEKPHLQENLSYGREKTRAYLMVIASNLIHDLNRKHKVRETAHQSILQEQLEFSGIDNTTPEKQQAMRQKLLKANQILESLSPKCRNVFKLSRFHHMGYREIAKQMNISVSMVKKYVAQALLALRTRIDFDEEE